MCSSRLGSAVSAYLTNYRDKKQGKRERKGREEGGKKEGRGKEGRGKEGRGKEGRGKEGRGKEGRGKEGRGKEGREWEGGRSTQVKRHQRGRPPETLKKCCTALHTRAQAW